MPTLRSLLYPVSLAYRAVTNVRNKLYDSGKLRSFTFDRTLISVGNLAVGGTGKTPMVEYLVESLMLNHQPATLSRGYGRKTTGYRLASPSDTAITLGDEPYQYYTKWGNQVPVAVGEDRSLAITKLLFDAPTTDIIVLDDAYQHRRVKPQFQILLSTYQQPFWNDVLLPAGMLREAPSGAQRANIVVITKCPEKLSEEVQEKYRRKAAEHTKAGTAIVFSTIAYQEPVALFIQKRGPKPNPGNACILISGLANARPLEKYVKKTYGLLTHHKYSDHHKFSQSNLQALQDAYKAAYSANKDIVIITSEKDAMRLLEPKLKAQIDHLPIYYTPIKMQFLSGDDVVFWNTLKPLLAQKGIV